ncbi:MAG TPA: CDP-glycerol glycerophosphotransferase family protein [Microbacteriaceae bacterium]|nr:CDP-glycerol glycerophosphotransferase family protein [Microbacteriaceae bacterium]
MRFDRNNLTKLLRSPLLAVGWLASWLVPRDTQLWAFGSGIGFGEGGVSLSSRAVAAGKRVVWLSQRRTGIDAARAAGYPAWPVHSLRGWWITLRASTLVVSHGLGDVNPYAQRGATLVQLWHGVPLKHLHRDAGVTYSLPKFPMSHLAERLLRWGSERAYARITHFVAASEESGRRLASAFGLRDEQLLIAGDPRDDVLLSESIADRRAEARAIIESATGRTLRRRILLFAPTWRDGEPDPVVPTAKEWDDIATYATSTGVTCIVRPHPLAIGAYRETMGDRADIILLDVDLVPDITPVLPACDLLITDYSSIAYDFALLGRPMVYLAPDLEAYQASRGLYEPIELFCGGAPLRTWSATLKRLTELEKPEAARAAQAHAVATAARVHAFQDGRNADRVMAAILGSGAA